MTAIGPPPPTSRWVHVADRGAAVCTVLAACQAQRGDFAVPAGVGRVWEPDPPPAEPEPLAGVRLTAIPVAGLAAAWERAAWDRGRWAVADFHQGLQTGGRMAASHRRDEAARARVLGFRAPLAVRLLGRRQAARLTPPRPAAAVVGGATVAVVAARTGAPAAGMTAATLWRLVARRGGHQGRNRDGPPGWRPRWQGWFSVPTLLEGVHLASHLPHQRCGERSGVKPWAEATKPLRG